MELDDHAGSALRPLLRRKKWVWLAVSTEEIWLSLAIVRMGYASSAFAFVFDRASRRMLVDRTRLGSPRAAAVSDDPHASGDLARFRSLSGFGRTWLNISRYASTVHVQARVPGGGASDDLEIDALVEESRAPAPISAIADLSTSRETLVSATEKRALASVRGRLVAAGRRFSLDGGLGGYDYTHGLMPRHTRWKWAFAMGHSKSGDPIAFNVVSGFVGEAECAAFTSPHAGGIVPLEEPRFELDADEPSRPWRLVGPDMNLTFDVGAIHAQHTNLGVARSRFLQPVGTFRGTLTLGGEEVVLEGVPGVVEDQDVLW